MPEGCHWETVPGFAALIPMVIRSPVSVSAESVMLSPPDRTNAARPGPRIAFRVAHVADAHEPDADVLVVREGEAGREGPGAPDGADGVRVVRRGEDVMDSDGAGSGRAAGREDHEVPGGEVELPLERRGDPVDVDAGDIGPRSGRADDREARAVRADVLRKADVRAGVEVKLCADGTCRARSTRSGGCPCRRRRRTGQ